MNNWKKSLMTIALVSVSVTGLQFISEAIASAKTPTLAQNSGICSFINANNVNIRSGPNTQSRVVAKLKRGDGVRAVVRKGNWVEISGKVTSKPGVTPEVVQPLKGWVQNTYINGCSEDKFDMWRQ